MDVARATRNVNVLLFCRAKNEKKNGHSIEARADTQYVLKQISLCTLRLISKKIEIVLFIIFVCFVFDASRLNYFWHRENDERKIRFVRCHFENVCVGG